MMEIIKNNLLDIKWDTGTFCRLKYSSDERNLVAVENVLPTEKSFSK